MQQPDPVDSSKMNSADDYKHRLLRLLKNPELLGTEERLDTHDELERVCKRQLEGLREQERLDSLQREWETEEGLNRMVMKAIKELGGQGFDNLPQEEIERRFKEEMEPLVRDAFERHMCGRWVNYFETSHGMQGLQPLPDDLPLFRSRIERRRRQNLQHWQHERLLCIDRAHLRSQNEVDHFELQGFSSVDKFAGSFVTNNVFSIVQAQGSQTKMEEKIPTTVGSVCCAGDESRALLAGPTTLLQQFLLNNPGGEGNDILRSNHAPTVTSSTEENLVPLVHQLPANQSHDKREFYSSQQDEDRDKPIQMIRQVQTHAKDTSSDCLNKSVGLKGMFGMTVRSGYNLGERVRTSRKLVPSPRPGEKGFVLHSAYAKGNRVRKTICIISTTGNGGSSSEGTESTLSGGGNQHRETDSPSNDMPTVLLDSQAQENCTGNFNVLSDLTYVPENIVFIAADKKEMPAYIRGSVRVGRFDIGVVYFVPELDEDRIYVSGSKLDLDDYHCGYGSRKCCVTDLKTGRIVGEGSLVEGNYKLDYLKIPRDRTPGLVRGLWNAACSALHRLGL